MSQSRSNSREKILAAAIAVAREDGPGGLSLEAVAARAGISKGGLLYNFPSKAKLLEGLVHAHIEAFETTLAEARKSGASTIDVVLQMSDEEIEGAKSARSWVLTALIENPDFMAPAKAFHRRLLDRLIAESPDRAEALIAYLAIEGMRSLALLDTDVLTDEERASSFEWIRGRASRGPASGPV